MDVFQRLTKLPANVSICSFKVPISYTKSILLSRALEGYSCPQDGDKGNMKEIGVRKSVIGDR